MDTWLKCPAGLGNSGGGWGGASDYFPGDTTEAWTSQWVAGNFSSRLWPEGEEPREVKRLACWRFPGYLLHQVTRVLVLLLPPIIAFSLIYTLLPPNANILKQSRNPLKYLAQWDGAKGRLGKLGRARRSRPAGDHRPTGPSLLWQPRARPRQQRRGRELYDSPFTRVSRGAT